MIKMNDKCLLVTPHNIQDELIKNEIEQNRLQFESFKEQKYNEILRKYKQLQNNWNELKKKLERRIKSYEDRKKLGEGYELTEVMEISLACDKRFLKEMQELQGDDKS